MTRNKLLYILIISCFFSFPFIAHSQNSTSIDKGIIKYHISAEQESDNKTLTLYSDSSIFYRYGDYLLHDVFEKQSTVIIKGNTQTETNSVVFKHLELLSIKDSIAYIFVKQNDDFELAQSHSLKQKRNMGLNIFFNQLSPSDSLDLRIQQEQQNKDESHLVKFQIRDKPDDNLIDNEWLINPDWNMSAFKVDIQTNDRRIQGLLQEAKIKDPITKTSSNLKITYVKGLDMDKSKFISELIQKTL